MWVATRGMLSWEHLPLTFPITFAQERNNCVFRCVSRWFLVVFSASMYSYVAYPMTYEHDLNLDIETALAQPFRHPSNSTKYINTPFAVRCLEIHLKCGSSCTMYGQRLYFVIKLTSFISMPWQQMRMSTVECACRRATEISPWLDSFDFKVSKVRLDEHAKWNIMRLAICANYTI